MQSTSASDTPFPRNRWSVRALIVDDDAPIRELLCGYLARFNIEAVGVTARAGRRRSVGTIDVAPPLTGQTPPPPPGQGAEGLPFGQTDETASSTEDQGTAAWWRPCSSSTKREPATAAAWAAS